VSKYRIKTLNRKNTKDYLQWKIFLKNASGSTIFHNPDFLSYHGNKFNECHIGIYKGKTLVGIIPGAIVMNGEDKEYKSPYGASYGGFIFDKILRYSEAKEIILLFINYLEAQSIKKVTLIPSLPIFFEAHSDTFSFALLEQGFKCSNSDITSILELQENNLSCFNSRARRSYKNGEKNKLSVVNISDIDVFWNLMTKTFNKHGVNPTHSKEQFTYLYTNLKKEICVNVAYYDGIPIAGIAQFRINKLTKSSFYLCQDDEYKILNAQTFLIKKIIDEAYLEGYKYYDFGTSSVNMIARPNIFEFKEGLGAIGEFRHTYTLEV